ncbi:LEAF RUST 10 DISEASE-RESISTANCE LOCUS RECEPTOR-LIKE PROTEIN KINASE-like 2.8 [Juglans regia]|uniref:non-specific serine/threonine protein kinase n=2 Tax=Juglans regia TaxID=51240 RepID=A0A6P9EG66_JUGRE|nr:LEAF RUST 10 DISEASE-RESISTANCE LOCUS RECEPTOR-LIKE PROTEIN KINASE-like 2.8 [Juglans regia]
MIHSVNMLSLSMARGIMSFPAVLTTLFVLLLFHQTCSVKDIHLTETGNGTCSPSSCGSIQNISYPFRLMADPPNCGDQRYKLSCENNITVLYLYGGKYYVQEINYSDYTIRVVDSGIQRANFSSIPPYFLTSYNFSDGDPYYYLLWGSYRTMAFLSCEKQVINSKYSYLNIPTNCSKNEVYSSKYSSSSSQMHRYVTYQENINPEMVEESCRLELISLISDGYTEAAPSCEKIHNELLYGFRLYWFRVYCEYCDGCDYDDDANKIQCWNRTTDQGFFERLEEVYNGVMNGLGGALYVLTRGKLPDALFAAVHYHHDWTSQAAAPIKWIILVLYLGLYLGAKLVIGTPIVVAFLIYKWRRRHLSMYDAIEDFLQSHNNLAPIRYSYPQIRKMSKNFKDKLGEGGYGTVFKGTLRSGRLVAIKILTKSKANGQDFINEVATIGRIHHVNVVQLIGFCVEGSKRALVYEFMSKGSLNDHIFMKEGSILISYKKMHEIALGVARGIEYLHRGCDIRILHFDIKPHNILLDENLHPKLSDFGLAKSYPIDDSIVSLTAARGTFGYMAPEFFYKNIGGISYKADVYSFGMLLMEMAGRRKNLNEYAEHSSQIYFPTWVYDQLHDGNDIEMEEYATKEEEEICKLMIIVALWCI